MKQRFAIAVLLLAASALPARAATITIDSTNCSSPTACFGLSWMLTINTGTFMDGTDLYGFEAILNVSDDTLISGVPTKTISAVDFKVSDTVDTAVLRTAPTSLNDWGTGINVLSSAGCVGPNAGFVCSQSASSPALFTGSQLTWSWYFNTSSALFQDLDGAHIGAKLVPLSQKGQLLSEEFHTVPEPGTLLLLSGGIGMTALRRLRRFGQVIN